MVFMIPYYGRTAIILFALVFGICACAAPTVSPDKPHHTSQGFVNPQEKETTGFWDFLKWRWSREDIPGPEAYDFPLSKPDLSAMPRYCYRSMVLISSPIHSFHSGPRRCNGPARNA
jgi:hypothetical protein